MLMAFVSNSLKQPPRNIAICYELPDTLVPNIFHFSTTPLLQILTSKLGVAPPADIKSVLKYCLIYIRPREPDDSVSEYPIIVKVEPDTSELADGKFNQGCGLA